MVQSLILCPDRLSPDAETLASEIAPKLQALLESARDERSLQGFLDAYPQLVGWRFGHGFAPTLVRSQFRLGSEFVTDFLVIDSPQWTDVYLVEIESPLSPVFNKDGTYSRRLAQAIKQTSEWRQWIADNRTYFSDRLLAMIDQVLDPLDEHQKPHYTSFIRDTIGHGAFQLKTGIIIGRRAQFGNREERLRRGFLESGSDVALFSFDALLDTCINRFSSKSGA